MNAGIDHARLRRSFQTLAHLRDAAFGDDDIARIAQRSGFGIEHHRVLDQHRIAHVFFSVSHVGA